MRRLWPWFLILLALVPAALVHPAPPKLPAHVTPVVIVGVVGGGSSLNPAVATGTPSRLIADNLFPTLFRVSSTGLLEPGLATSASTSGNTVTVTLGRDRLADGVSLTPTMVRQALSETLWPQTASTAARALLGDVQGAKAVEQGKTKWVSGIAETGPETLQFTLKAPVSNWAWRLANPVLGIVPVSDKSAGGTYWSTSNLVGPGPYRLVSSSPNASMQFQQVASGANGPLIEVERYGSVREAALALVNGEASVVSVPASALAAMNRAPFKASLRFLPAAPQIELLINPVRTSAWAGATGTGPSIARVVQRAFLGYVAGAAGAFPGYPVKGTKTTSGTGVKAPTGPTAPVLPLVVNGADAMTTRVASALQEVAPGRYHVSTLSGTQWTTALDQGTVPAVLVKVWPGSPLPPALSGWKAVAIAPSGSFWLLSPSVRHSTVAADGALLWTVFSKRQRGG